MLGQNAWQFTYKLHGDVTEEQALSHLLDLADLIGMEIGGKPGIWSYPTHYGKGGVGFTILLPIVESYLVVDAWPELSLFYLTIFTCKRPSAHSIELVDEYLGGRWRVTRCSRLEL